MNYGVWMEPDGSLFILLKGEATSYKLQNSHGFYDLNDSEEFKENMLYCIYLGDL